VHATSDAQVAVQAIGRKVRVISSHGGRGVAAIEPIRCGELIERAPVILVPEDERSAIDASTVGSYIFMWEHGTRGEDLYSQRGRAAIVLGYASLVNHSNEPNCTFMRYIEALALDVVALRDIAADEELTFNYDMTLWFTPQ
jgi:SET domain-containing protein